MVTKMPPSAISTPSASGADPITSMLASRSMKAPVATEAPFKRKGHMYFQQRLDCKIPLL
jgi:hypothetical protein